MSLEFSLPQGSPAPGEQPRPATPAPRNGIAFADIRVTTDSVPMLDTAKFEHMQRIASLLADWPLLPPALRTDATGAALETRGIAANCFMIVNQAVRWRMDPFAVALSAGVKDGRLIWEGKLVHAVIETMTGVRLNYGFDNGEGDQLAVTVWGRYPDEAEARSISGRVADWRAETSAWSDPAAWPRQMRYRGAREWARTHAPSVMLGVVTDDETLVQRRADAGPAPVSAGCAGASRKPAASAAPDIPDDEPAPEEESQDPPEVVAVPVVSIATGNERPDQVLLDLREALDMAKTAADRADVADNFTDRIEGLPPAFQAAARKILKESE